MFDGVIGVAFLLSCSACLVTADLISAERREGTLGLLFLTRIKRLDVLLGKLGSVGITSLCALVAFLPVLMIPVLAGGVTGGEAFRKGLALFGTLWFALAAGAVRFDGPTGAVTGGARRGFNCRRGGAGSVRAVCDFRRGCGPLHRMVQPAEPQ